MAVVMFKVIALGFQRVVIFVVSRPGESHPQTGSPEAVTRVRLPQNVACGFPALRSSNDDSQHNILL